jgi:hypothetical protein
MGDRPRITTFKQLLESIGDVTRIAARCDVPVYTAATWLRTGRVPVECWSNLLAGLKSVDLRVSEKTLARLPSASGCRSFTDIIGLFPSMTDLAIYLRLPVSTVHSWRMRNAVPVKYWHDIVDAGPVFAVRDLTLHRMNSITKELNNGSD